MNIYNKNFQLSAEELNTIKGGTSDFIIEDDIHGL